MSTETILPTAIEASTNLTGAITTVDEDITWTPLLFPSLTGWWDATDLAGQGDASTVTAWNDKSGNSRNFGQRASDNRPTKVTDGNYTAVSFVEASAQHMANSASLATLIGNTGLVAIAFNFVGGPSTTNASFFNDNGLIMDLDAGPTDSGYWGASAVTASSVVSIRFGTNASQLTIAAPASARHLLVGYRTSGSVLTCSLDGAAEVTAGSTAAPTVQTNPLVLGRGFAGSTNYNGYIYEIVTSSANGAAGDRSDLITSMRLKWGI